MAELTTHRSDVTSQRRPWLVLGLLVAAHAAFNLLLNPLAFPTARADEWLMLVLIGGIVAQPVLFAAWGSFGPAPSVKRIPLTVAAFVFVLLVGFFGVWSAQNGRAVPQSLNGELLMLSLLLFAVAMAAMLLVRLLTRLRIGLARATLKDSAAVNQFSLKYLLTLTTGCAVLLGIGRGLAVGQWLTSSSALNSMVPRLFLQAGLILLATFPALVIPLIVLLPRPPVRVLIAIPILWAILTWLALETVVAIHSVSRSRTFGEIILLQLGAATVSLASAFVVRRGGYRLIGTAAANSHQTTLGIQPGCLP